MYFSFVFFVFFAIHEVEDFLLGGGGIYTLWLKHCHKLYAWSAGGGGGGAINGNYSIFGVYVCTCLWVGV